MKIITAWIVLLFPLIGLAKAGNQVLVLSGGGSPSSNHYSQYLQTKTVYEDLSGRLDYNVSLFFGAGHSPDSQAFFADVHKIEKRDGVTFSKYIVGAIKDNAPATKENVLEYFRRNTSSTAETLFLVVSDHGMPNLVNNKNDPTFSNNCIDLWDAKLENGELKELGSFEETRCLSKNELKHLLSQVPTKRKVFAMSQCFSGGFHQMSVDESEQYPKADTNVCGFTAVTHDTWASGCSPDVDGPTYQGYERSFTEQLTGFDYVNNKRIRQPRGSFVEAHQATILEDLTVDIPLATSEYYLWRWSTKLADPSFTPRSKGNLEMARAAFNQAANFSYDVLDSEFLSKKRLFKNMAIVTGRKFPELRSKLRLPYKEFAQHVSILGKELTQIEEQMVELDNRSMELYKPYAQKYWLEQLASGSIPNLTATELATEKYVQELGKVGGISGSNYLKKRILPVTWRNDPSLAESQSVYLSQRLDKVSAAAISSGQPELIEKTNEMIAVDKSLSALSEKFDLLQKQHGLLRRVLIYREVLGAWAALSTLNDSVALGEIQGLLACEKTKL